LTNIYLIFSICIHLTGLKLKVEITRGLSSILIVLVLEKWKYFKDLDSPYFFCDLFVFLTKILIFGLGQSSGRPDVFKSIIKEFGQPEIDLFASSESKQLDKYISWKQEPEAIAIDAFTVEWKEHLEFAIVCTPPQ